MNFTLPKREMRIHRDQLEDAKPENLVRLARFVAKHSEEPKFKVDDNWDHKTLARKVFWEINPLPTARMY